MSVCVCGKELEIETVLVCVYVHVSECVSRGSELKGETDSVCVSVCV